VTLPLPFSARLREATKHDHVAVERSPFMGRLLRGELEREAYVSMLISLAPLYHALEETLPGMPEWVRQLHPPALLRSESLRQDVAELSGASELPPPVPSARRLAARIRQATDAPHLWIAHAWVRYMGDLSGGQALARIVRESFGLEGTRGTAFYAFPGIEGIQAFKECYRGGLDRAPVGRDALEEAASEAKSAFAAHQAIFAELMS
jgi:heme oxygenase (biliverdin-producing, ferredoxin)